MSTKLVGYSDPKIFPKQIHHYFFLHNIPNTALVIPNDMFKLSFSPKDALNSFSFLQKMKKQKMI